MSPSSGNMSRACTVVNATIVPAVTGTLPQRQPGRDQVDDRGDDREEDLHHREEPLAAHLLAHLQAHLVVVLVRVAPDLGLLLVEALREQDAGDAESVSCVIAVISRQRLLRLGGDACPHLADPALGDHEHRHEDDGDDVSCQESRSIAHEAAITVTVLPSTLETVLVSTLATPPTSFCSRDWMMPVLVRVKKRELHALQVAEQFDAQRAHDLVADRRGEPGLPDPEERRMDVDAAP